MDYKEFRVMNEYKVEILNRGSLEQSEIQKLNGSTVFIKLPGEKRTWLHLNHKKLENFISMAHAIKLNSKFSTFSPEQ